MHNYIKLQVRKKIRQNKNMVQKSMLTHACISKTTKCMTMIELHYTIMTIENLCHGMAASFN